MKVGDLVKLSLAETMKGLLWEETAGIVIEITSELGYPGGAVVVNFGGTIIKYSAFRLRVISEDRSS
jgi:hypothetical protein|tara:strand:+ start:1034 stop:1234 length:201 start_codon:yes stop_codon:yes gene_type:complete